MGRISSRSRVRVRAMVRAMVRVRIEDEGNAEDSPKEMVSDSCWSVHLPGERLGIC